MTLPGERQVEPNGGTMDQQLGRRRSVSWVGAVLCGLSLVACGRHASNDDDPVITVMGVQVGLLLSGAVVIEQIYGLPGIGWMILNGIYQRDYTLVQGGVLFVAVAFVLVNLVVDLFYAYLDPRVKLERAR